MYLQRMNDLVNKVINNWTILEARPNKLKGMVLAKCVCGKEVITRGRSIKSGVSKSCGCKRKEYSKRGLRIPGSKPALKKIFSLYRTKAERAKLEFTLTIEEFQVITQLNCFYCDKIPSNKLSTSTDQYIYSGIDRLDNSTGYTIINSVPCCGDCNTLKGGITVEMIKKVYRKLNLNA